mmetsp:Transcript_8540/g.25196  ORF Transcript_8540/g.25196 Transcript_8540/m.25196 type:complete len:211 (-) Transcript_8540:523-1155(-)
MWEAVAVSKMVKACIGRTRAQRSPADGTAQEAPRVVRRGAAAALRRGRRRLLRARAAPRRPPLPPLRARARRCSAAADAAGPARPRVCRLVWTVRVAAPRARRPVPCPRRRPRLGRHPRHPLQDLRPERHRHAACVGRPARWLLALGARRHRGQAPPPAARRARQAPDGGRGAGGAAPRRPAHLRRAVRGRRARRPGGAGADPARGHLPR